MRSGELIAGRYRIERKVGAGGMGTVFRALDADGDVFAVKILNRQLEADIARFEREAELLSSLRHPGIVGYVEHGVEAGQHYLVMRWADGRTLAELLQARRLSVREVITVGIRIAEALHVAHEIGVLHRDLKPGNIALPSDDPASAILLDFGIARRTSEVQGLTQTGVMVGTPAYMSPEQARGERHLDRRADVFGLGCLLYECLSGEPPFGGGFWMTVRLNVLLADPAPLENVDDPALTALVHAMLAKRPEERPASTAEVGAVLAALADRATDEAPPARAASTSASQPPTKFERPGTLDEAAPPIVQYMILGLATDEDDDEDVPDLDRRRRREDDLRAAVSHTGAQLDVLADGSVVATVAGRRDDDPALVERAALCALALRLRLGGQPISISCVSGPDLPDTTLEAVIDATVRQVIKTALTTIFATSDDEPIQLDAITAQRLQRKFVVRDGAAGRVLMGER
ncbi:MAG TPA: serine/threonine-protein kinase [Kofleriaceae bacterium]|nr:serine/threonine-protein kinase [Kofleriaceae bacterium]